MIGRRAVAAAAGLALAAVVTAREREAAARTAVVVSYAPDDVWPAVVRFLRVDRGLPVREKDRDAGYVLFDYPDGGRTYRGALELVATTDAEGRAATQIVLSLGDLPRHHEIALCDRLVAKLREERGTPPPPPAKRAPAADGKSDDKSKGKDKDGEKAARPDAGLPRAPTVTP